MGEPPGAAQDMPVLQERRLGNPPKVKGWRPGMNPYYQDKWVTIYHGDCCDVLPQLPRDTIDLVCADPPYGIEYKSGFRRVEFDIMVGDTQFPEHWLGLLDGLIKPNCILYVFCNEQSLQSATSALIRSHYGVNRLLVWDKGSTTGGDLTNYGLQTEFIIFGQRKNSGKVKLYGSRDPNLVSIPFCRNTMNHPTRKPASLIDYLVIKSSKVDDYILDPFLGSGTTCYCAKKLGRRSIGIEIEEKYCEIAARRCSQEVMELVCT